MDQTDSLVEFLLRRRGVNFEPDETYLQNCIDAVADAMAYLRKIAGNPELAFTGELRELVKTCAWYFLENRKAEFDREYSGDLVQLRLMEAFGCGKYEEPDLS